MADMPSNFWGGWITVITVISLIGLAWVVISAFFSADEKDFKSPIWDKTITKDANPVPLWWFWMILGAMVFSVIYLILYPGLGTNKGMLNWSQIKRHDHSVEKFEADFSVVQQRVTNSAIETLQADPAIMASAKRVYIQHCSACHGVDGQGQVSRFPNLRDGIWQWGGSEADIENTLKNGRQGIMIGWENTLGKEGVTQLVDYIRSSPFDNQATSSHPGALLYQQYCVACHGASGEGNPVLGAPNLADASWLYGNSVEELHETIANGRNGIMPAFKNRLDDMQTRMLVAWLTKK